jgi:hypothetical protein
MKRFRLVRSAAWREFANNGSAKEPSWIIVSNRPDSERVAAQNHKCDQRPDGTVWVGVSADEFHKAGDACSFADFI